MKRSEIYDILLKSRRDRQSPMHTHAIKAENIINRGGQVMCGGILRDYTPGEKLVFKPGECVTLRPVDWHAFWGESGNVLIGEVSTVNDNETDNIFREPIGRFANIKEDVDPAHLLVSD